MIVTISAAHNNARLAATIFYLDLGAAHARIRLYDGIQPASGGPVTNLLAEIALDKPCGVVATNALNLTSADVPLVLASGSATWARIVNGNGDMAIDCDVSDSAGAGAIKLIDTTLYAGGKVVLASAVLG